MTATRADTVNKGVIFSFIPTKFYRIEIPKARIYFLLTNLQRFLHHTQTHGKSTSFSTHQTKKLFTATFFFLLSSSFYWNSLSFLTFKNFSTIFFCKFPLESEVSSTSKLHYSLSLTEFSPQLTTIPRKFNWIIRSFSILHKNLSLFSFFLPLQE